jgi:hypothetical protein
MPYWLRTVRRERREWLKYNLEEENGDKYLYTRAYLMQLRSTSATNVGDPRLVGTRAACARWIAKCRLQISPSRKLDAKWSPPAHLLLCLVRWDLAVDFEIYESQSHHSEQEE